MEAVVEVYPIPQPSRGSGERRKLLRGSGTLGRSPSRKRCLGVLGVILCHFSRVLVHFGRWLSGIIGLTPKIQENITGVGNVTLHACIFNSMLKCNRASEKIFGKVRARL